MKRKNIRRILVSCLLFVLLFVSLVFLLCMIYILSINISQEYASIEYYDKISKKNGSCVELIDFCLSKQNILNHLALLRSYLNCIGVDMTKNIYSLYYEEECILSYKMINKYASPADFISKHYFLENGNIRIDFPENILNDEENNSYFEDIKRKSDCYAIRVFNIV